MFLRQRKFGECRNVVVDPENAAVSMPSAPSRTIDAETAGRWEVNQTVVEFGVRDERVWKVDLTGVVWHSQNGKTGLHFRPSFPQAEVFCLEGDLQGHSWDANVDFGGGGKSAGPVTADYGRVDENRCHDGRVIYP